MNPQNEITVHSLVHRLPEAVWKYWTDPEHITQWNAASDDWYTPTAQNDVTPGGRFNFRMEARDGSMGFNMTGTYNDVQPLARIQYTLDDGRTVKITFEKQEDATRLTETFEAESTHTIQQQQDGWQAILDNFKRHAEAQSV